ncbi:MAG: dihydrodipicolinate synthase family protein [Clostridia bacterium]|nr:dihydrodipicolinate synthase family protein [Clostridia bacterium]
MAEKYEKRLNGIVPALFTPLREDGSLDEGSLEKLIEYQLAAGVHGIFVAGMSGEGALLGPRRLRELILLSARIIHGRVPLCAGVLEEGTDRVIETARMVEDAGADMLSTTVPLWSPAPTQEEIFRHFEAICKETGLPWMVYGNAGAFTDITPETMERLSELERIHSIKDTRPDFEGCLRDIEAIRGKAVSLLCGGEYLVGPGLLYGADGNISGATNLFPKLFMDLYRDAREGRVERVREAGERIAAIHGMTRVLGAGWLSVFKYMGSRMGLMQPWCCRPHVTLNSEQQRKVDAEMERLGVL